MSKETLIYKYKTFNTSEEFEFWQSEKLRFMFQFTPSYSKFSETKQEELSVMNTHGGIFVVYTDQDPNASEAE